MSWLDTSPTRPLGLSKPKEAPGSRGFGAKLSSGTRTYGKRRPSASKHSGSAARADFGGGRSFLGTGSRIGLQLASTYEEEPGTPKATLGSTGGRLMTASLESSPTELTFAGASRGLDLDLDDSPIFPHVPKKKAASKATSKATKPKATVAKGDSSTNGRAGRAAGRARKPSATGAAGREKSVLTGSREVSVDDPATTSVAPKRKNATTASTRKPRTSRTVKSSTTTPAPVIDLSIPEHEDVATAGSSPESPVPTSVTATGAAASQHSPKQRRERSPGMRARGRPDRGGGRAPAAAGAVVSASASAPGGRKQHPAVAEASARASPSPLRPITNTSDEGGRGGRRRRGKTNDPALPRPADREVEDTCEVDSSVSGSSSISSSSEEEWKDDFDVSKRPIERKHVSRPKRGAGGGGGGGRSGVLSETKQRQHDQRRNAAKEESSTTAMGGRDVVDPCDAVESLVMSPGQALTPSACTPQASVEPPPSLDSSVDGILVGDKRRRGSGRSKRGARAVEDNAHRSSRSRHLSPLVPVSSGVTGFPVSEDFTEDEEEDVLSDAEIGDLLQPNLDVAAENDVDYAAAPVDASRNTDERILSLSDDDSDSTRLAPPAEKNGERRRSLSSSADFFSSAAAPALSRTHSPRVFGKRRCAPTTAASMCPMEADSPRLTSSASNSIGVDATRRHRAEWGDDNPPLRISRSLSHASGTATLSTGGGGAGGGRAACAKVTGASFRRRSRANSLVPLPVLETSTSLDKSRVEGEAAAGFSSSSWSISHSSGFRLESGDVGLGGGGAGGGGVHHMNRRRRSMSNLSSRLAAAAFGGGMCNEAVGRRSSVSNDQVDGLSAMDGVHDKRPMSLPKGVGLGGLVGAAAESLAGDATVGWVLRAPSSGISHGRHRSNSFASGRKGFLQARHLRSASVSGLTGEDSSVMRSSSSSAAAAAAASERRALGDTNETSSVMGKHEPTPPEHAEKAMGTNQTPQTSPSQSNTAARQRSNNLSSVARRMDRLEIRSPDVDTQAAQAQKAILGSPICDDSNTMTLLSATRQGVATVESDAGVTPVRSTPVSSPFHFTPVDDAWGRRRNPDRLSRGSGGGGSPAECLRDYSSGERDDDPLVEQERPTDSNSAIDSAKNTQQTPSTPAIPSHQQGMVSPPMGVMFTRTAAVGLPTPVVAGLFGSSDENSAGVAAASAAAASESDHRRTTSTSSSNDKTDGYTHGLAASASGSSSSGSNSKDYAEGSIARSGLLHDDRDSDSVLVKNSEGVSKSKGLSRGGNGERLVRHSTWSPPKPRKGSKLGMGPRARTVPSSLGEDAGEATGQRGAGLEDGPDGGFLIRRKSMPSPASSSPAPGWQNAFGDGNGDDHSAQVPPSLRRMNVGSGASSSSMYLSCLSVGGDMESPSVAPEERPAQRRSRSISSPLPIPPSQETSGCDTPAAFHTAGGLPAAGVREDYDGGTDLATGPAETSIREAEGTTRGSVGSGETSSVQRHEMRSPEFAGSSGIAAAPPLGLSDGNGGGHLRRSSTESVGLPIAASSRAIFETPQAEAKFKWGSRPQYGDWGISQPASARSLKRLAGRLMAFAGRATGGRLSGGPADHPDPSLHGESGTSPNNSIVATPQRYNHHNASSNDADDNAHDLLLTSINDYTGTSSLRLLPLRSCPGSATSSTCSSKRDRSSFGMNIRNSLGTLAERGGVDGAAESEEYEEDDAVEEGGLEVLERGGGGEGGGEEDGGWDGGNSNGSAAVDFRVDPWESVDGNDVSRVVRDGGRSGLGSLMSDGQREAQRRRQSKAKMRRVSMSMKSRLSTVGMMPGGVSSLGLMNIAEGTAASPGQERVLAGMGAGVGVGVGAAAAAAQKQRRRRTSFGMKMMAESGFRVMDGKGRRPGAEQPVTDGLGVGAGGVIAAVQEEGQEDDESDGNQEEPSRAGATPSSMNISGRWAASPMSTGRAEALSLLEDDDEEGKGDTPAKVREDLEKSLTELTNLSISLYNSESDESPSKRVARTPPPREFVLSPWDDDLNDENADRSKNSSGGVVSTSVRMGVGMLSSTEALRRHGAVAKALCMLSVEELLGEVPVVCRAWCKAASLAFSEVASAMSVGVEGGEAQEERYTTATVPTARTITDTPERGCGTSKQPTHASTLSASSRSEWPPEKVAAAFPWGSFLSEGSFKQVFKVWNAVQSRMEALSVMDCDVIAETESQEVISQELRVSILTSSLVQRGICPNFVQTFGLFRCCTPPPPDLFGTAHHKYPHGCSPGVVRTQPRRALPQGSTVSSANNTSLRYQFIGMELCGHGDAEGLIRDQPDKLLPLAEARSFLFQMAFSLYVGRAELSMRHFDVKLLNFLVADASALLTPGGRGGHGGGSDATAGLSCSTEEVPRVGADMKGGVALRYAVGSELVELCMPRDRAFVVKLADFGTADVNPGSVGAPVEAGHFTTLENTPIEQLCCGSSAQQDYASDTFAFALAALHLFTGEAPYEEIMEEVECPDDLYDALANTWSDEQYPEYSVLCDIVLDTVDEEPEDSVADPDCKEEGEEEEEEQQSATLFNTFYRYLVLFGVPDRQTLDEAFGADNPVWSAVGSLLGWKSNKGRGRRGGGLSAASKRFSRRFREDQARFSLEKGTNPTIARGRARLEAVTGTMELVKAMASFCPGDRPTMLEVLTHEAFAPLRKPVGPGRCREQAAGREEGVMEFMAFVRRDGDSRALPDV